MKQLPSSFIPHPSSLILSLNAASPEASRREHPMRLRVLRAAEDAHVDRQISDFRNGMELHIDPLRMHGRGRQESNAAEGNVATLAPQWDADVAVGVERVDANGQVGRDARMGPALRQVLQEPADVVDDGRQIVVGLPGEGIVRHAVELPQDGDIGRRRRRQADLDFEPVPLIRGRTQLATARFAQLPRLTPQDDPVWVGFLYRQAPAPPS